MNTDQPQTVYLEDYLPPCWTVRNLHLHFELDLPETCVTATATYSYVGKNRERQLVLDGEKLELLSIHLDGYPLPVETCLMEDTRLVIPDAPESFQLQTVVRLYPEANKSLEGLYESNGILCTQCEAEGFRRITYFLDRPDVMTRFTTRIIGNKSKRPVLLSNGNLVEAGDVDGDRHFAVWEDPHPKPAYLFAMVAGILSNVEREIRTQSGRNVALRIYSEPHNIDRCDHAMNSLVRAMRWDEESFGLEYDLDIYMIVAVDDFNAGAMENKGLNIFNSSLVFATPQTATDDDYHSIEAVIAHEYFHNWTGNRITCRDWFQLSLKEGLTVFRDQEFSSRLRSRAVQRIKDARSLRAIQFAEDAGPLAHPVRPSSYIEINNFYTATVYEKGAEIVRLYCRLLGQEGFRRGMDLYFSRHDGQAVTTEDFLAAMADANHADLAQMQRWYDQAGTPVVTVSMEYEAETKCCRLSFRQRCPPTPETPEKLPFLIPIEFGLLSPSGRGIDLLVQGQPLGTTHVLTLRDVTTEIICQEVAEQPVPSLLRGFSAPVEVEFDYADTDYALLMEHDTDPFNRWQAGHYLALRKLRCLTEAQRRRQPLDLPQDLMMAYRGILNEESLDEAFRAEALSLPSFAEVTQSLGHDVDPQALYESTEFLRHGLAQALQVDLQTTYEALAECGPYTTDPDSIGRRSLRNVCLGYLARLETPQIVEQCQAHFRAAENMTDSLASLAILVDFDDEPRSQALKAFEARWRDNAQVMDYWFSIQASSKRLDTLKQVERLMEHESFTVTNPNKVRALFGAFAMNYPHFHARDGSGYVFVANRVVELDGTNPQIAARLVRSFVKWRHFEEGCGRRMRDQLKRIAGHGHLSSDVYEIVHKSLVE